MGDSKKEAARLITRILEGGDAGFARAWWESLDAETKDLLMLLLAERMSYFSKKRREAKPRQMEEEYQQFQKWGDRLAKKYPGIKTDGEAFLDWLVSCHGKETEDAYLFGVREGIMVAEVVFGGVYRSH